MGNKCTKFMKGHRREASYATQEHGHEEILFKVEQHASKS
jgi:hypothetical protein